MTYQDSKKTPADLDFQCSIALPWQLVAAVAAHKLLKLSALKEQEVFSVLMCHPVFGC